MPNHMYTTKGMSKSDKAWFNNWVESSNHVDLLFVPGVIVVILLLGGLYYMLALRPGVPRQQANMGQDDIEYAPADAVLNNDGGDTKWYDSMV